MDAAREAEVRAEVEAMRGRASDYVHAAVTLIPDGRFVDVDGDPDHALVGLAPGELVDLVAGAMAAVAHSYERAITAAAEAGTLGVIEEIR